MDFDDIFVRCAGSATARQLGLSDVLGDRSWAVDIGAGTAMFDDLKYRIQLLGTEAERDHSWLWAWANEASGLPSFVLTGSQKLRAFGAARGLDILAQRAVSLGKLSGHQVAMVCSTLLGNVPYYRGPYDGGALYFTLEGVELPPVDGPRIVTVLSQVITTFDVDHRLAAQSFLSDLGYAITASPRRLDAVAPSGLTVRVDFEAHGRLSNLHVSHGGSVNQLRPDTRGPSDTTGTSA
jgi:hypothetical protein